MSAAKSSVNIIASIKQMAESILPSGTRAILFGSRARGDNSSDSDWDLLIIIDKTSLDSNDHDRFCYPFWELGWKMKTMIHPLMYTSSDWEKRSGTDFFDNVNSDGIRLC